MVEFGRFSLRASQVPPSNAFVSLPWLQQQLEAIENTPQLDDDDRIRILEKLDAAELFERFLQRDARSSRLLERYSFAIVQEIVKTTGQGAAPIAGMIKEEGPGVACRGYASQH